MTPSFPFEPLGNICEVLDSRRKPVTKKDRVPGPYPYYGATGILDYVESYLFDEKLVLIGEDGAKWGAGENTAFSADGKYWVNNHAHIIRPDRRRISDSWLIYYLNATDLSPFISGLTVPKLNQARMREISIPLPPLAEQRQIVAILDEAFAGIARAVAATEKNLASARELFESNLNGVFENSGAEWHETRIGDQLTLQRGFDITKTKQINGDVPVVSSGGIKSYHNASMAKAPGVVIGRKGTIGKVYFIEHDYWPHDTTLWVKDFKGNNPRFVFYLFARLDLTHLDTGTANPALNRNQVHPITINWPKVDLQDDLVRQLDSVSSETHRLESLYRRKLAALAELKQSLLQKAFTGELTANALDEEAAA